MARPEFGSYEDYHSDFTGAAAAHGHTFSEALEPVDVPQMQFQTISEFAAVDEETAKPIMGDEETCLLSHGGMMKLYGDGGAGKTTLEIDFLCHLGAGDDWLGISVPEPVKILIIENEGPRGMFRKKLRRKLASWTGSEIGDRIIVLEDPWAMFTFDKERFREQLELAITHYEIDLVSAGPVQTLGIKGGGTPEEVAAFKYLVEEVRQHVERPVAALFVGHENKAGDVAGAWEGVPDTLVHLSNQGHGSTRLFWQKCRWGPALHGKTWQLSWTDGETFELVEAEIVTSEEMEERVLEWLAENPDAIKRDLLAGVQGNKNAIEESVANLVSKSDISVVKRGNAHVHNLGQTQAFRSHRSHRSLPMEQGIAPIGNNEPVGSGLAFPPHPHPFRGGVKGTISDNGDEELDFGSRSLDPDGDIPF